MPCLITRRRRYAERDSGNIWTAMAKRPSVKKARSESPPWGGLWVSDWPAVPPRRSDLCPRNQSRNCARVIRNDSHIPRRSIHVSRSENDDAASLGPLPQEWTAVPAVYKDSVRPLDPALQLHCSLQPCGLLQPLLPDRAFNCCLSVAIRFARPLPLSGIRWHLLDIRRLRGHEPSHDRRSPSVYPFVARKCPTQAKSRRYRDRYSSSRQARNPP